MRTEKKYTGYWNFNSETPTIAGTLIVGNDIVIEIVEFNDKSYYTHLSIDGFFSHILVIWGFNHILFLCLI